MKLLPLAGCWKQSLSGTAFKNFKGRREKFKTDSPCEIFFCFTGASRASRKVWIRHLFVQPS